MNSPDQTGKSTAFVWMHIGTQTVADRNCLSARKSCPKRIKYYTTTFTPYLQYHYGALVLVTYLDYTDTWKTGFVQIPGQPVSRFLEKWRPSQLLCSTQSQSKQNKIFKSAVKLSMYRYPETVTIKTINI